MRLRKTDVYDKGILLRAPLTLKGTAEEKELLSRILDMAYLSRLRRLSNTGFSIIANNCCGSFMYESLRLKKLSPTCDMEIASHEFVGFCRHLKEYLRMPVDAPTEEDRKKYPGCNVPIGILRGNDVLPPVGLIFTHYDSLENARETWYRRRERVNYDKLFFVMDCGVESDEELLDEFEQLPYENKVIFTKAEDRERWKDTFCFRCFTDGNYRLGYVFDYLFTESGLFNVLDEFDYVSWLNREGG